MGRSSELAIEMTCRFGTARGRVKRDSRRRIEAGEGVVLERVNEMSESSSSSTRRLPKQVVEPHMHGRCCKCEKQQIDEHGST